MSVVAAARGRSLWIHALLALVVVAGWAALSPPGANDLAGGDEGYYGVMAHNVAASPAQWPVPSLAPLGPAGDKPPLYPALIAASLGLAGDSPAAVRLPSLVCAFVILLALARLARRLLGERGALFALLVLSTLPWFADAARVAAAESPLTALGLPALVLLAGTPATPAVSRRRAALAGALLGLAFLCKLWLVLLIGLPALALLWPFRDRGVVLALLAGAMAPPLVHLGLLLALRPDLLAHWLRVVIGFSLQSRAAGAGYADYWFHGPLYYPGLLTKAFIAWTPFALVGLYGAGRAPSAPASRVILGALASVLLLAAFKVQSGGYLFPVMPLFALLVAASIERAWSVARVRPVVIAAMVLAAGVGAWRITQRLPRPYHRTGYREIAAALAPHVAAAPVRSVSILAPEAPVFAFALGRGARYWDTPYDPWTLARFDSLATDTALKAFVIETAPVHYGGWPGAGTLAWLERHTHEITLEIHPDGAPLRGVRVFVRP